jgi:hypothetical protein
VIHFLSHANCPEENGKVSPAAVRARLLADQVKNPDRLKGWD